MQPDARADFERLITVLGMTQNALVDVSRRLERLSAQLEAATPQPQDGDLARRAGAFVDGLLGGRDEGRKKKKR